MVSGFLSPGLDKAVEPEGLDDYLDSIGYRLDANAKLGHKDDRTEFFENAHETIDARHEAFDHFVDADDWDLFFGVFMTTDRVNHFSFRDYERDGPFREEFLDFYQRVDEHVGALRDALPDDVTTIVASDHGFTTLDYEVNCNEWLRQNGWLSYDGDDHQELVDIADGTRAFSLIPGRFYLNLEGREPRGSVPKEEYEATVDELRKDLEAMEGPNGTPVADRVVEKTDAFRGDHADLAPDLVMIPNKGFDLKSGFGPKDTVFNNDGPRNGMHSFDNATLITDESSMGVGSDVDLLDIAPTLLDLMDLEFARSEFDGGSLVDARS